MPTNYSNQLRMRTVRKPGEGPSDGAQRNARIAAMSATKRVGSEEDKNQLIKQRTADAEKRKEKAMQMSQEESVTEANIGPNVDTETIRGIHQRAHARISDPLNKNLTYSHPGFADSIDNEYKARKELAKRGINVERPKHRAVIEHRLEETINEIFGFGKKSDQKDLPKYPDGNKAKEWMTAKLNHVLKHNPKEAHHLFSPASPVYMPKDVHAGSEWKKEHQDHYRELKKKHPDLVQKAKKHMESNGPYIQSRVGDDQDYYGVKLREETNTEKRVKVNNVDRPGDAIATSKESTLGKTGSIKKIIEEKPTMSLPNFGLSASLIAAARQIVEKKDDVKLTGGKTKVEVDPKTNDGTDDDEDTSTSKNKKKLDRVGDEDGDINNDGKKDETDEYLQHRRDVIGKKIRGKSFKKSDKEVLTQGDFILDERENSPYERASDKALSAEFGYPISYDKTPKTDFGRAANRSSAAYALRALRKNPDTDTETGSDAVHQGWAKTATTNTDQTPEKKARRAALASTPYSKLPDDEKQKDRVAFKAVKKTFNNESFTADELARIDEIAQSIFEIAEPSMNPNGKQKGINTNNDVTNAVLSDEKKQKMNKK